MTNFHDTGDEASPGGSTHAQQRRMDLSRLPLRRAGPSPPRLLPAWRHLHFSTWQTFRLRDFVLALAVIAVLLGSLLVHELAHAFAARRFRVRTTMIQITPFGGMARLAGLPRSTAQTCALLFAGPWSNLILAMTGFVAQQLLALDLFSMPDGTRGLSGISPFTIGGGNGVSARARRAVQNWTLTPIHPRC
jgi:Zn-dependent protease